MTPDFNEKALAGLLQRKPCWLPSLHGWRLLALCCAGLAFTAFFGLYQFLALIHPVHADVLVVEGWVADDALQFTAREFHAGHYRRLYTTGGPLRTGSYLIEYKTFADLGAATLRASGLDSNAVVAVPAPETRVGRSYQSALALRKRLSETGQRGKALNVVTVGAHARRARLLYQHAFGDGVTIGVIAVPNADYDSKRWWRFSAGLRDVIGETCGYAYSKLVSP
jgi:hypothetical protein